MRLCQELSADKWGQAAGLPSESCGPGRRRPSQAPEALSSSRGLKGCWQVQRLLSAVSSRVGAGGGLPPGVWSSGNLARPPHLHQALGYKRSGRKTLSLWATRLSLEYVADVGPRMGQS